MSYNIVQDYTNVEVGYVNGPVTIAMAQAFCRVENTTAEQNTLFLLWINAARTKIEQYTNLSLIPRNIVAVLNNPQGSLELPFGPVTSTPTFVDQQGVAMTIVKEGLNFPYIPLPFSYAKATYTAGYADGECPEELIQAMLLQICYWWENRGDQSVGTSSQTATAWCPETLAICQKWRRNII